MATELAPIRPSPPTSKSVDAAGVLRSEWTKLRSVRSTYWTLIVAAVLSVGFAALVGFEIRTHWISQVRSGVANFDPTMVSLSGIHIAQIAIGVLGVLTITSEYSTGMIRSTLVAVPQRRTMLLAKAAVFAVVALVVGEVISFVAFFVGQALLTAPAFHATLSQPGVLRAVAGAGLYVTTIGLLGLGIGALIRHSAGAITTLIVILLVIPILVSFLPGSWGRDLERLLPLSAGMQITTVVNPDHAYFSPAVSMLVCIAWALVALGLALVAITRRDA